MIAVIRRPNIVQVAGNMARQRPPIGDGGNAFYAGDLVYIASGVLALVPTDGVLVWGQTKDDSHTSTQKPPDAFFGENHYCESVEECTIEMNITNDAGGVGDATTNNGAAGPQLSAAAIGTAYGIHAGATDYVGVQMVNVEELTATLVTVVGYAPNQSLTDYNGRVLVRPIASKIQAAS